MPDNPEPEEDDSPSAPFWMTTYGDMVTLLLTFFILMFAMSSINEQKFLQAAASLSGALGVLDKNISQIGELSPAIGTAGRSTEPVDLLEAMEQISAVFREENLEDIASWEITGEGDVIVRLGDEVLYDPGQADLKAGSNRVLDGIAQSIIGRTEQVIVEGHTDNQPINTEEFRSNWELSTARAVSVVKLLESLGIPPEQLAAVGHGEYVPIEPNDTPEGRARNRRVELKIIWSGTGNE